MHGGCDLEEEEEPAGGTLGENVGVQRKRDLRGPEEGIGLP